MICSACVRCFPRTRSLRYLAPMSRVLERPAAKKPPTPPENPLELFFFRPAAELVVRAFLPMPLSDVGLTLLGVGIGIAGASLFRFTTNTMVIGGSALMVLYVVLNRAGGGLAKIRGTSSRFGWGVRPACSATTWSGSRSPSRSPSTSTSSTRRATERCSPRSGRRACCSRR